MSSSAAAAAVASPVLATTPSPAAVTLGTSTVTLADSAVLTGGLSPTGTITFTLIGPGSAVDTETVTVNGNGTYTTPTGFTLPTIGAVAGTYQWNATYSGNATNNPASDSGSPAEQVVVGPASPALTTTPDPAAVTLTGSPQVLADSAVLSGGHFPTGTITFTLIGPGGTVVDTETVTVNGNGAYTTPTGFTLPAVGAVTGTYRWDAVYSGDANNNSATEFASPAERVEVSSATSPALATTPSPAAVTLGTSTVTLTDSAVLTGGSSPTGTITFTLIGPGGTTVDTETVTVNGNGTYTTPTGFTLPTTEAVTGTYQWNASYSGDANNSPAADTGDPVERVVVSAASPALTTTPDPAALTVGTPPQTLADSAALSGGYFPTGTITFTLIGPGGTVVDTETVTVNGNGTYTTPTGFTLPTTGVVTGTYQWNASYSGDANNDAAADIDSPAERVVVSGTTSPPTTTSPAAPAQPFVAVTG